MCAPVSCSSGHSNWRHHQRESPSKWSGFSGGKQSHHYMCQNNNLYLQVYVVLVHILMDRWPSKGSTQKSHRSDNSQYVNSATSVQKNTALRNCINASKCVSICWATTDVAALKMVCPAEHNDCFLRLCAVDVLFFERFLRVLFSLKGEPFWRFPCH